jgi:hypothetical protein
MGDRRLELCFPSEDILTFVCQNLQTDSGANAAPYIVVMEREADLLPSLESNFKKERSFSADFHESAHYQISLKSV